MKNYNFIIARLISFAKLGTVSMLSFQMYLPLKPFSKTINVVFIENISLTKLKESTIIFS